VGLDRHTLNFDRIEGQNVKSRTSSVMSFQWNCDSDSMIFHALRNVYLLLQLTGWRKGLELGPVVLTARKLVVWLMRMDVPIKALALAG